MLPTSNLASVAKTAGLDNCDVFDQDKVAVLVISGAGQPDSPYLVQTLEIDGNCPVVKFNVIDAVALSIEYVEGDRTVDDASVP